MHVLHNFFGVTQQFFAWANTALISYYQRAPWSSSLRNRLPASNEDLHGQLEYL